MRCIKCNGLEVPDGYYRAWRCLNCGKLRHPSVEEQRPDLNVFVVKSMAALPEWRGRTEDYLMRQFKCNPLFGFVVPLDGGFASNYSSLTPAFVYFNAHVDGRRQQAFGHPFTGGFTSASGGSAVAVTDKEGEKE